MTDRIYIDGPQEPQRVYIDAPSVNPTFPIGGLNREATGGQSDLTPLIDQFATVGTRIINEPTFNTTDNIIRALGSGASYMGLNKLGAGLTEAGSDLEQFDERMREENPTAGLVGTLIGSLAGAKGVKSAVTPVAQKLTSAGRPAISSLMGALRSPVGEAATRLTLPAVDIAASETGRGEYGDPVGVVKGVYSNPISGGGILATGAMPAISDSGRKLYKALSGGNNTGSVFSEGISEGSVSEIAQRLYQAGYSAKEVERLAIKISTLGREGIPYPVGAATTKTMGTKSAGPLGRMTETLNDTAGAKVIADAMSDVRDNSVRVKKALDKLAPYVGVDEAATSLADDLGHAYIKLLKEPRDVARTAYKELSETFPNVSRRTEDLRELFNKTPALQEAWEDLGSLHAKYGEEWIDDLTNMNQLDILQKSLGDEARAAKLAKTGSQGTEKARTATRAGELAEKARTKLLNILDDETTVPGKGSLYKEARTKWIEAQKGGRGDLKILRRGLNKTEFDANTGKVLDVLEPNQLLNWAFKDGERTERLSRIMGENSTTLREALRASLDRGLREGTRRINTDAAGSFASGRAIEQVDPTKILKNLADTDPLNVVAPESANKILSALDAERELKNFDNLTFGNSQTAPRLMEALRQPGAVMKTVTAPTEFLSALFDGRTRKQQINLAEALMASGNEGQEVLSRAAKILSESTSDSEKARIFGQVVRAADKGVE